MQGSTGYELYIVDDACKKKCDVLLLFLCFFSSSLKMYSFKRAHGTGQYNIHHLSICSFVLAVMLSFPHYYLPDLNSPHVAIPSPQPHRTPWHSVFYPNIHYHPRMMRMLHYYSLHLLMLKLLPRQAHSHLRCWHLLQWWMHTVA